MADWLLTLTGQCRVLKSDDTGFTVVGVRGDVLMEFLRGQMAEDVPTDIDPASTYTVEIHES